MRILKYLFLLLVLLLLGITVFVATINGNFSIKNTTLIKVSKNIVFDYVNDYKNWEDWVSWKTANTKTTIEYSDKTRGKEAWMEWDGNESSGEIETVEVKDKEVLKQKLSVSGVDYESLITFKDTLGGTKVKWIVNGTTDFWTKLISLFEKVSFKNSISEENEESLKNLNKLLNTNFNVYDIKVNGFAKIDGTYYLRQSNDCKPDQVNYKIDLMLRNFKDYFKENNLKMNGKPFVIYNKETISEVRFTVCAPLRQKLDSVMQSQTKFILDSIKTFSAVKATLKGDYSHKNEAINKIKKLIFEESIELNPKIIRIERFQKTILEVKSNSEWITEIIYPLFVKPVIKLKPRVEPIKVPEEIEINVPFSTGKKAPEEN
jgi:Holliday junction resolvase